MDALATFTQSDAAEAHPSLFWTLIQIWESAETESLISSRQGGALMRKEIIPIVLVGRKTGKRGEDGRRRIEGGGERRGRNFFQRELVKELPNFPESKSRYNPLRNCSTTFLK